MKIFLLECAASFDSCSCVSLGTNTTDNYSVFVRKEGDDYAFQIKDSDFTDYFPDASESLVEPRFVDKNPQSMSIPDRIDTSLFKDKMWDEYSERCIACGRCNASCPTCSCFCVKNIKDADDKNRSVRKRVWSSCQVDRFCRLAGDHEFRKSSGDRMRYKVLHKVSDFKKRFGFHMCVGCGRCDDVCPEYISMAKCVDVINKIGDK